MDFNLKKRIGIVGAGFSGSVIAEQLSKTGKYEVQVFDSRPHTAGNCHCERDEDTGVLIHVYGPHIFHTSNEEVWQYIQQFDEFMPYINRVKAISQGKVFSLPINLLTINQFFGRTFSPREAELFIHEVSEQSIQDPISFEEQALKFVGKDLYHAFFRSYTLKQWGIHPSELPASILKRLPIRFNYNDNYFNDPYQGIPRNGYTYIVNRMLDQPGVEVYLNRHFTRDMTSEFDHVFYSGPIDSWFNYNEGRLGYRTLDFEKEVHEGDFQGNAVINYCDQEVPWTRISEHKHFAPWETHEQTVIYKEFSRVCGSNDVPYYPIRLVNDKAMLKRYINLANQEKNTTFVGRLGTYRYLDMHVTIAEALNVARTYLECEESGRHIPSFLVNPI